jgi:hypothetical protein
MLYKAMFLYYMMMVLCYQQLKADVLRIRADLTRPFGVCVCVCVCVCLSVCVCQSVFAPTSLVP